LRVIKYLIPLLFLIFIGCESQEPKTEDTTEFQKLNWLIGVWEGKQGNLDIYESWSRKSFRIMEGVSTTTEKRKPLHSQTQRIEQNNNKIRLIVTSGDNQPVILEMKSVSENQVEFINPSNTYPERVIYSREGKDKMKVIFEGEGNKSSQLVFSKTTSL
jgi:hypothetical protein